MLFRSFPLLLAVLVALLDAAHGQVSVEIKPARRTFLSGEAIPVTVSVTNLSGTELTFQSRRHQPWIDFIVKSSRGVPMPPIGEPAFGAIRIPPSKTLSRTIDLNQLFGFSELGNFSIYAIVRLPNQATGGFQSRRCLFNIASAKPTWSQVVGIPGKPGRSNEMRLIRFSSDQKDHLYVQVADHKTGRVLRTHRLGESLSLRRPTVALDSGLNMHVLYLATPAFWGYASVDPEGEMLHHEFYRPTVATDPRLARLENGTIQLVGGTLYDAEKEAKERANSRKTSDRPDFIYE